MPLATIVPGADPRGPSGGARPPPEAPGLSPNQTIAEMSRVPPQVRAGTPPAPALPAAGDLLRLTKPRITALVTFTAVAAALAAGASSTAVVLHLAAGTLLLSGGTNTLNQWLERDADGRMERTRGRPLPAGRVRSAHAAAWGTALVGSGAAWLAAGTNLPTALLGLTAAVLYVAAYTPMKRRSPVSLLVGAVPGALPALGGWVAVTGEAAGTGLALFGVLFLWQLPHFLALGWLLREDYRRAGFSVLAVEDPEGVLSGRSAVLSAAGLIPVSLAAWWAGTAGLVFAAAAVLAGVAYLAGSIAFARRGTEAAARRLFLVSLAYLPAVLGALALDVRWL